MKRYFLVPPAGLPSEQPDPPHVGEYHYLDLDSHGPNGVGYRVLVLMEGWRQAPDAWVEFPHLLDAQTTLGALPAVPTPPAPPAVGGGPAPVPAPVQPPASPATLLTDVGAKPNQTGYALALQLATIHPAFKP